MPAFALPLVFAFVLAFVFAFAPVPSAEYGIIIADQTLAGIV